MYNNIFGEEWLGVENLTKTTKNILAENAIYLEFRDWRNKFTALQLFCGLIQFR